jgi:uncharacterized protein (UPF0297 family)
MGRQEEVLFMENRNTQVYGAPEKGNQKSMLEILSMVYDALEEKGYNAIDQMVGYILSGDPSYITGHNNARNLIRQVERDDLVEELLHSYLGK